jgi:hypothetical protein
MSTPGRPKSEYRSAQHEGTPVRPTPSRLKAGERPSGAGHAATWGQT